MGAVEEEAEAGLSSNKLNESNKSDKSNKSNDSNKSNKANKAKKQHANAEPITIEVNKLDVGRGRKDYVESIDCQTFAAAMGQGEYKKKYTCC